MHSIGVNNYKSMYVNPCRTFRVCGFIDTIGLRLRVLVIFCVCQTIILKYTKYILKCFRFHIIYQSPINRDRWVLPVHGPDIAISCLCTSVPDPLGGLIELGRYQGFFEALAAGSIVETSWISYCARGGSRGTHDVCTGDSVLMSVWSYVWWKIL